MVDRKRPAHHKVTRPRVNITLGTIFGQISEESSLKSHWGHDNESTGSRRGRRQRQRKSSSSAESCSGDSSLGRSKSGSTSSALSELVAKGLGKGQRVTSPGCDDSTSSKLKI